MLKKIISYLLIFVSIFPNFSFIYAEDTVEIPEIQQESTNSGTTDSPTQTIITNPIPDIIITFQSPSYLTDKNLIQDTYHCDTSKAECKVNFDLSDTFGGYVSAEFACLNNFSFTTGEENKCNPNTIIFSTGTSSINFKIYEKDNPSNFKEKSIVIVNESEILEIPEINSGTLTESGTVDSNSGSIDSGTGELSESGSSIIDPETSSGGQSVGSEGQLEIPNIDIEIQSGLELIDGNYKCKNTDCKINLNLENLFTGTYNITDFSCEWNFGSGTFTTIDTDKKCNPGYVNYGTGNFSIEAKIYEKDNPTNFKTGNLSFYNGELLIPINSGTGESSESGSSIIDAETSSEGQISGSGGQSVDSEGQSSVFSFPNIKISFQSPSYLLEKEIEKNEYYCDQSKGDCKINFDLIQSFSGFSVPDYLCHIDFPFESTESGKCNPNTVIFPIGENTVNFYIKDKNDETNFISKTLKIINNPIIVSSSIGGTSSSLSTIKKEIIIQSGASKIGENTYECNEEKCKINMQYENSSNETCFWDFGGGIYKETYTTSCNPSFVYYYSGEYKIRLNINKNGVFSEEKSITLTNNFLDNAKIYNLSPTAKIKLQGTIGKNKEIVGNKLVCKNTTECSVNFDGSESSDPNKDNLEFFWDFGNGEFEEKSNPKTVKYSPGKYKVKLKVTDRFGEYSEDYFFVEVYEKEQEVLKINENIAKYIKIIEALPNPVGSEENEWIKIKNDSINFVNIKGLEVDDKIGKGSKSYIIKNDFYLLPYGEKKLYKEETKLNLNNSFDELNLIYNSEIIDKLVWNYEVPEGFVVKKELKEKVKVINVIDGDTIVIQFSDGKKEKLRLIGVDTPETKHPTKAVEKFGIEASNYTKNMLNGKEIELELDVDNYRDKYDRLLGYVRINNLNFNKLLIEKGYGRAYLYFPFKYSTEFAKAEKEAKKNKLGIWGDDELKKEMQLLEKLEKDQILENKKMNKNLSFETIITNISNLFDKDNYKELILNKSFLSYFNLGMDQKEIQKENLKEFDLLLSDLFKSDKKITKSFDNKQEKIIIYKTSKLKSGLKITGVTFPNSFIILNFDETRLETKSNEAGNYTFLITDNLKVGNYELQFLVSNGGQNYSYFAPRSLILSKDYIFGVQDYKLKQFHKKVKNKKAKKAKKKKLVAKKSTLKKMKYDIKDIKKEADKSTPKNIILIFLISILVSIMGFFIIRKVD